MPMDDAADEAIVGLRLAVAQTLAPWPLSDEQAALVRTRIEGRVAAGRALRRVALTNADAPEIDFVPWRADAAAGDTV